MKRETQLGNSDRFGLDDIASGLKGESVSALPWDSASWEKVWNFVRILFKSEEFAETRQKQALCWLKHVPSSMVQYQN